MENIGIFFVCKIKKYLNVKTEIDHELIWLNVEQAIVLMYLDNQKEALKIFSKI